ncbi:MAG: beta-ketoacyl-[Prevotella sp.]|nr:beta-ketoacyl-[acyl-carrier-protein] synthase family protein [Prevotella sp.]
MNPSIVITGEGIVCAIGLDKDAVLASLRERRTGIGTMRYLRSVHQELPVGEVPLSDEEMRRQLGLVDAQLVNRTTLMGMLAVRQALADAAIDVSTVKRQPLRLVLVSGTTVAGMDITERFFRELQDSDEHLRCLLSHSAGSSTRLIADYFGIFGEYTTISTACSSAANALILGANLLKAGQADIVVAGGTEALSVFHLNGFNSLMILDHEQCRPFDETRAGLNLGEGAAFVVLEREEQALQRRAEVHGYLSGYGNACDAFHQTASSEDGEGACLAMTEALRMAQLQPGDIQYVNAHGTGTPNNDQSESVALRRVFGERMPLVSSTKGFTGHTTSASGSIETVICLLALRHQFVPANLGCTQPLSGGIVPTMGEEHCELRHVLCNSFGFGGNDTSLVVSSLQTGRLEASNESFAGSIRVLSKVEINSEEELTEIRDYVKPLEARRMGKIMKSSLLSSLKALKLAGLERPDAIITGTALGCLENSEQLLLQIMEEGETMLKPTYFMQSTHNTISSNIAIRTKCHGYNVTYTQDGDSLAWAMRDAELLLRSGKCKTVLVGCHDETTPLFRSLMRRLGEPEQPAVHSIAMVLTCGE